MADSDKVFLYNDFADYWVRSGFNHPPGDIAVITYEELKLWSKKIFEASRILTTKEFKDKTL